MEQLKTTGLTALLKRFNETGKYANVGDFSIGRGGYDLDWELYYQGTPIVDSVAGELQVITTNYNLDKVLQTIIKVYPEYQHKPIQIL